MHLGDLTSITTVILQKTIRMLAHSLLSVLLLLFSSSTVWCAAICNNRCCSFVEGFPARLKMLRENYANIRDYYVSTNDNVPKTSAVASFGAWADRSRPPIWAVSLQEMLQVSVCSLRSLSLQTANDDLDVVFLDQSIKESFKVSSPPQL